MTVNHYESRESKDPLVFLRSILWPSPTTPPVETKGFIKIATRGGFHYKLRHATEWTLPYFLMLGIEGPIPFPQYRIKAETQTMQGTGVDQVVAVVTFYGLRVLGGIAILIIGWMVARWLAGFTRRQLAKSDAIDATLTGFFSDLVKYLVLAFVGIAVLNQLGVQTTSLIAIFGAAGLAIGLALQGTLSDIAAGVMLLIFRPISIGQYVEAGGKAGTVKELSLFTTELATPDNVQIILPNSSVWGAAITNYSYHKTRRADWTIGISYGDDISKAFDTARKVLSKEARILPDPEPALMVSELADSSVNITIRAWVNADDFWSVKFDLSKSFKEAFDESGLVIPFPQRDVHVIQKSE